MSPMAAHRDNKGLQPSSPFQSPRQQGTAAATCLTSSLPSTVTTTPLVQPPLSASVSSSSSSSTISISLPDSYDRLCVERGLSLNKQIHNSLLSLQSLSSSSSRSLNNNSSTGGTHDENVLDVHACTDDAHVVALIHVLTTSQTTSTKNPTHLRIIDTPLAAHTIGTLATYLTHQQHLTHLTITCAGIAMSLPPASAETLVTALRVAGKRSPLQYLALIDVGMTAREAKMVAKLLEQVAVPRGALTTLDLSNNRLNADGVDAIVRVQKRLWSEQEEVEKVTRRGRGDIEEVVGQEEKEVVEEFDQVDDGDQGMVMMQTNRVEEESMRKKMGRRRDSMGDIIQVDHDDDYDDDDDENVSDVVGLKHQPLSDAVGRTTFVPFTVDVSGNLVTIELWNAWTHGVGAAAAFFGGVHLVRSATATAAAATSSFLLSDDDTINNNGLPLSNSSSSSSSTLLTESSFATSVAIDAACVYSLLIFALSLFVLLCASCAYHASFRVPKLNKALRRVDHMSIFVLIAGTYTPFLVCYARSTAIGVVTLVAIWASAGVGMVRSMLKKGGFVSNKGRALFALATGWLGVMALPTLWRSMPKGAMMGVFVGGGMYSGGMGFYLASKKVPVLHVVWHCAVVAGSVCHYVTLLRYVAGG